MLTIENEKALAKAMNKGDLDYRNVINAYTKDKIKGYLDYFGVKYSSSIKKHELVDYYLSITYTYFERFVLTLNKEQIELFMVDPNNLVFSNLDPSILFEAGWAHFLTNGTDGVLFIPKELKVLSTNLFEKNVARIEENTLLMATMNIAASKFGIFNINDIESELSEKHLARKAEYDKDLILDLVKNTLSLDYILIEDSDELYIYHKFLINIVNKEKLVELYQIINENNPKGYQRISQKVLDYYLKNKALKFKEREQLIDYIVNNSEESIEYVKNVTIEVDVCISIGMELEDVIMQMLDIYCNENIRYKAVKKLIGKFARKSCQWGLKGNVSNQQINLIDMMRVYFEKTNGAFIIEDFLSEEILELNENYDEDESIFEGFEDGEFDQEFIENILSSMNDRIGYRNFKKNMTTSEALKVLRKGDLVELANGLNIERLGKEGKPKLVTYIKEAIHGIVEDKFKYLPLEMILEIRDNTLNDESVHEYFFRIEQLGLGFEYIENNKLYIFVPKDIREKAREHIEKYHIIAKVNSYIYTAVNLAIWKYGIVKIMDLKNIILKDLKKHITEITSDDHYFSKVFDYALEYAEIGEQYGEYLCHGVVVEEGDPHEIKSIYKGFTDNQYVYTSISIEEIERYRSYEYCFKLYDYYKAIDCPEVVDFEYLISELKMMASVGANFDEDVIDVIHELELSDFLDTFKINQLKKMMIETCMILPNWFYMGKSLEEIGVVKQNINHEGKLIPLVNDKKIGRNDPCPCGSGKKYKKCCLNNTSGNI